MARQTSESLTEREAQIMDETERYYQAGYHAGSLDDCPYPKAGVGPYVLFKQGYDQHQRDRNWVAERVARLWCMDPLKHPLR